MAKINCWEDFENKITDKREKGMTCFFDYCLICGGNIKALRRKVMDKQQANKGNRYLEKINLDNCKLYTIKGETEAVDGKFFGHMASRINEGYEIEFGGLLLDETVGREVIWKKYNNDENIQVVGYKNIKRTNFSLESKFSQDCFVEYLPMMADVKNALKSIGNLVDEIQLDQVLDQIEQNLIDQERKLKSNWRMVTERNIALWYENGSLQ